MWACGECGVSSVKARDCSVVSHIFSGVELPSVLIFLSLCELARLLRAALLTFGVLEGEDGCDNGLLLLEGDNGNVGFFFELLGGFFFFIMSGRNSSSDE